MRDACPRSAHAAWKAPDNRPHTVQLLIEADKGRLPELIPLRHGRMVKSPFAFYRGAALNMAADLATTPNSGIRVQCGGDSHLSNFGGFGTPERQVIFAINDLDETLPAPWEWDVKRLAASFVVACRDNGLGESAARDAALNCVRSYREHLAGFSKMNTLDVWYYSMGAEMLIADIKDPVIRRRAIKRLTKARTTSAAEDIFPKLVDGSSDKPIIKDQRPTIFHFKGHHAGKIAPNVRDGFDRYARSLSPSHRVLLDRFTLRDAAIKVVGVGSVGTSCSVLLLTDDEDDPLFLQVKEARASVLEPYAGKSVYANHGQRVVNGYRLMQSSSDMFLGWSETAAGRHFYVRQLRDMKIRVLIESFGKSEMLMYSDWCGQALALSHARSGDAALISGYLGKSDAFDQAVASFSVSYADQSEKDHAAMQRAVHDGKLKAIVDDTD